LGRAKGLPNDLDAVALKHRVEALGELLIAVTNQKATRVQRGGQCPRQLSGRCVTHGPFGFGVHPATWTRRLPSLMKNGTYNR
jgi:hypothetical protein